jgi:hypothetical protein
MSKAFETQVLGMLESLSERMSAVEQAQAGKASVKVATKSAPKSAKGKAQAGKASTPKGERGELGVPSEDVVVKAHPVTKRMYLHIRNDGVQGGRFPEALAKALKHGRKPALEVQPRGRYVQDSFPFKASKQLLVAEGQDAHAVAKLVAAALLPSVWDSRKTGAAK